MAFFTALPPTKDVNTHVHGSKGMNVRFGLLAECTPLNRIVRFTPESCRGHQSTANPLWANSGRAPQIKKPPTGDLSAT
jgi:hypothetical protein